MVNVHDQTIHQSLVLTVLHCFELKFELVLELLSIEITDSYIIRIIIMIIIIRQP